ncbi:hypothetical protein HYH03_017723 [Edaphochlamys debaryana]|uniref:Protein kinase domain-containing protein n=1 Tax=Edaphochlamys debaryana TaxID=47281 RepID=A0A836BNM1_9CHLO|nr:hypothetical protein HYH03_017723 [Edaphochlamys debaryana]|eukprot:KAG2483416.1 hypothetical protein HYH03_017723 [Edaphochlamys debaryana]
MNPDAAHSPLPAPPIAYAAEQGGDSGGDSDSAVVPAVVGGALGGVALIALVGITAWLVARRRRHRHSLSTGEAKEAAAAAAKDVEACRTPSLVALADPPSLPTSSDQTGVRSSALPLAPAPALGPGPAPAAPEPAPVSDPVVSPRSVSAKSLQHKPSSLAAFLGLGRPFSSQASARVPTLSAAGSRSRCSTAETALVSAAGDKASVTRTTKSDHCTAQGSAANESAAAADAAVSNGRLLQEQERGSTRSGGSEPTASAPLPPWSLDTAEEAVPVTALTPFVPGLVFGVTVQRPGQGDANASASAGGGGGIGGGGLILKGCAPGVVGFKPALGGASPGVAAAAAAAGSWTPTNTLQGLLAATAAEGGASAEAPTAAGAAGASGGAGARGDAGGGRPATSSHLLPSLDVAGALADMMQRVPPSQAFTDGGLATVGEGGGGGAGVALTTASGGLTQTEAPQCVELTRVALGKGAYGKVVEGMYGGRKVAVKLIAHPLLPLLAPEGGGGSSGLQPEGWQLKAFEQEVEVLGRCCHPNIVSLLAANLKPPRICLVLERMDTSLDRLLSKHRHAGTLLPMPAVMAIAIDVAKGLAFLHPTITHRDLKPGNILINQPDSDAPTAKLTDFGLSRLRSTVAPTQNPEVGTPAFMAPEVFDVQNYVITDKADMYAFGVILWQMLSGAVPWQGLDMMNIARAVTLGKARLPIWGVLEGPGSLAGGGRCDLRLKAVIQGCWEQDPQRRPAAAEVLKDLQLAREELSSGAAEPVALSGYSGWEAGEPDL